VIYGDFVAVGVAFGLEVADGLGDGALHGVLPANPNVDATGATLPVMTTR
jgi:hypothetical protein